jgi:ribosomal protein L34E
MTQDEIILAYQTLSPLAKGDPYFLDALNRLRQYAMQHRCKSCSDLKKQVEAIKKDRLNKIRKLSELRKKLNRLEEKVLCFETGHDLDQTPKNVQIKIVETWDENDFARALTLGHFSDRGF